MLEAKHLNHPDYFNLLPSEICRLILGYLIQNGHHNAALSLFTDSKELSELRAQYAKLSDLPLHLTQVTLLDLIQDYLQIANYTAHRLARTNLSCKLGNVAAWIPQLLGLNTTKSTRLPSARPIRPLWLPMGKSYLPPRVVAADRSVSSNSNQFLLPSVVVRPHLYSVSSVGAAKTVSPALSASLLPVTATARIPFLTSSLGERPLIRLVRRSAPVSATAVCTTVHPSVLPPNLDVVSGAPSGSCFTSKSAATSPISDVIRDKTDNITELAPFAEQTTDLSTSNRSSGPQSPDNQLVVVESTDEMFNTVRSATTTATQSANNELNTSDAPVGVSCPVINTTNPALQSTHLTVVSSSDQSSSANGTLSNVVSVFRTGTKSIESSPTSLPFTIFSHLPPASETKRLSVDSDSSPRSTVPPGQSRRRRSQIPRHMLSNRCSISDPPTSPEAHTDVDIERFLAELFSKPEKLATHLNAKLSNLPIYPDPATSNADLAETMKESSQLDQTPADQRASIDRPSDKLDPSAAPFISSELPTRPIRSPDEKTYVVERSENEVPNSLWDLLEIDLENCIDQLLCQFDGTKPRSEDTSIALHECTEPPVEVIDLVVSSDAPTPAYPRCQSAQCDSNAHTSDIPALPTASLPSMQQTRRATCLSPLSLCQLTGETSQLPVKRQRLNDSDEYGYKKHRGRSTKLDPLQTPNFKETERVQIPHTQILRHDLFNTENRVKMYDDFVRLNTESITDCVPQSTVHPSELNVSSFVSDTHQQQVLTPIQDLSLGDKSATSIHSRSALNQSGWEFETNLCSSVGDIDTGHMDDAVNWITVHSSTDYHTKPSQSEKVGQSLPEHAPVTREQVKNVPLSTNMSVAMNAGTRVTCGASTPSTLINTVSNLQIPVSSVPQSNPPWSESTVLLGSLQGLPLIPINQSDSQASVATLLLYPSNVSTSVSTLSSKTTTVNVPYTTISHVSQAIPFTTPNSIQHTPLRNLSNSIILSIANENTFGWKATPISATVHSRNVDLDSPNPHLLVPSLPQSSLTTGVCQSVSRPSSSTSCDGTAGCNCATSNNTYLTEPSISTSANKENRQPSSTLVPIVQKTTRRKILHLDALDVDRILSSSHGQ